MLLKVSESQCKNRLCWSSFHMKAGWEAFSSWIIGILSAPDLGLFYLCNIANKDFLEILMLGLISAISLAFMDLMPHETWVEEEL